MIYSAELVTLHESRFEGRRVARVTIGSIPLVVERDDRRVGAVAEVSVYMGAGGAPVVAATIITDDGLEGVGVEPILSWADEERRHAALDGVRLVVGDSGAVLRPLPTVSVAG